MYNIIIGTITIIGWVAGQFLIFSGHVSNGIALIVFFTVAGAIFYFRVWKILTPGAGGCSSRKKDPDNACNPGYHYGRNCHAGIKRLAS
jgi:hypothetical protein